VTAFLRVFSPEREDSGNLDFDTRLIPKFCGGSTPWCLEVGVALHGAAIDRVVPVSSTRVAEMAKLPENIHCAVNIGLVNEMKGVADPKGIDIHEVIRAAATKPFGFVPYCPGPGFGGHCIPIDPFYLSWKARQYGVEARFVELAGEVNRGMPRWVVGKLEAALAARGGALAGRPHPGSGHRAQEEHRRHARITRGADHGTAGAAQGRGGVLRPARVIVPEDARASLRAGQRDVDAKGGGGLRRAGASGGS